MPMKEYVVTMKSKDGHLYECKVLAENDDMAVGEAFTNIQRRGWDIYEYKLHQLERVK